MGLLIVSIVVGAIVILTGVIFKKYPQWISGYDKNNRPSEESIKQASLAFIAAGFVTIIGSVFSFVLFDSEILMGIFLITPIFLASVYVQSKLKPKYWRVTGVLLIVVLIGVFISTAYAMREPSVVIDKEFISISGVYGETIALNEINQLELLSSIPAVQFKTNGFALGGVKKGYFKLEGGAIVKLLLVSKTSPAIKIETKDSRIFMFNMSDSLQSVAIYNTLLYSVER